jgi:hypothetical protein
MPASKALRFEGQIKDLPLLNRLSTRKPFLCTPGMGDSWEVEILCGL